jgi:Tfp pilus assembly protein PilX
MDSISRKTNVIYLRGDSGGALVVAMMIMAVLTILGISAIKTSNIEVWIGGNEKLYQRAFYAANGAAELAPRVIRDTIYAGQSPQYDPSSDVSVRDGLLDELLNFTSQNNDGDTDSPQNNPDVAIGSALYPSVSGVGIDVDRDVQVMALPGGAMEFGAGYEGAGAGTSTGGAAILYRIEATSSGPKYTSSTVQTRYLYILGAGE